MHKVHGYTCRPGKKLDDSRLCFAICGHSRLVLFALWGLQRVRPHSGRGLSSIVNPRRQDFGSGPDHEPGVATLANGGVFRVLVWSNLTETVNKVAFRLFKGKSSFRCMLRVLLLQCLSGQQPMKSGMTGLYQAWTVFPFCLISSCVLLFKRLLVISPRHALDYSGLVMAVVACAAKESCL